MGNPNRALRGATALAIALSGLALGCGNASVPRAHGSHSEVLLLYDGDALQAPVTRLRRSLEEPLTYQGRAEPRFQVFARADRPRRDDFNERHIVLVTRLGSGGVLDAVVRERFPAADVSRLRSRGAGVFLYTDVWARQQVVAWVAASRQAALDSLVRTLAPTFGAVFESAVVARWTEALRESRAATAQLPGVSGAGFDIAVPASYRRVEDPMGWAGARTWVRDSPTRMVTVLWLADVDSSAAGNEEFLLGLQRDVLWRLHEDTLVEEHSRFVHEASGVLFTGTWQNTRDVAGGPLCARFVYDATQRRLFVVQGLLFAPGRAKHNFMRELRSIAQTFILEEPA